MPTASTAELLARLNDYRALLPKANTLEKMKMAQGAAELTLELLSVVVEENRQLRGAISELDLRIDLAEGQIESNRFRIKSISEVG